MDAGTLHSLGDIMLNLPLVIVSALIYFRQDLWMADPICTYLVCIYNFAISIYCIKQSIHVLMEGAPRTFDVDQLR